MNALTRLAAVALACLIAIPAHAEVCMVGIAKDTLNQWLRQTNQTPLLNLNITIGDIESLQAMIAVAPDGAWTLLYLNKDQTCIMAIGKGAMPAREPTLPTEPPAEEESL